MAHVKTGSSGVGGHEDADGFQMQKLDRERDKVASGGKPS